MADDVELRLLGEGMKRLQADVRDVKARVLPLESARSELRPDLRRLEGKLDALQGRMDDRFERMMDFMTPNFRLLVGGIEDLKRLPEPSRAPLPSHPPARVAI